MKEITIKDLEEEIIKCVRAWARYVVRRRGPLNLTEQAMFDAINQHDELKFKPKPKAPKTKRTLKQTTPATKDWFKGWSEVIQNQGKEQRGEEERTEIQDEDPLCQQCMQAFVVATSFADDNKRFCSKTCEKTFEKQLMGEDDDEESETEEA